MEPLTRFGISLPEDLLKKFDSYCKKEKYTNRSEAIRDLIRSVLIQKEWHSTQQVAGALTLIYDHHVRELMGKITSIQHEFEEAIISTQHIHLDHHNCLEIVAVKGLPQTVQALHAKLKALKGIKHTTLSMSSTGKKIS